MPDHIVIRLAVRRFALELFPGLLLMVMAAWGGWLAARWLPTP